MTLSEFATVSTAVSGLAVTASLIYLALQTYQNGKHTKALLQQGQSTRVVTTLVAMANPDLARAWITGNGALATSESVEALQFAQLCNAVVYDMQDFHNQQIEGLASDEQIGAACVGYSRLLQQPGMAAYWKAWKDARMAAAPRFIAWVERLAATAPTGDSQNWT